MKEQEETDGTAPFLAHPHHSSHHSAPAALSRGDESKETQQGTALGPTWHCSALLPGQGSLKQLCPVPRPEVLF